MLSTRSAPISRSFDAMVARQPDLERFVRSPVFTSEEQVKALDPILAKIGIAGLAANFLKLVAAKRRLFAIRDMVRGYRALVDENAALSGPKSPSPRLLPRRARRHQAGAEGRCR